ncbi:iron ABC transporter permease [Micromonospora tulbaghiae]|uniref:Iron ABC transporter permease n=1 Tax=Micromonospora tulbaghiae TaxID=479978 RepID=A0A386WFG0_9ACTN|nr:iron ABC transporter permease [Micromonospora tulbaghiae]
MTGPRLSPKATTVARRTATGAEGRWGSLAMLLAALPVVTALSIAVGSGGLAPDTVFSVLVHPDGSEAAVIVHNLRIPRTVLALAVGAALGMAGALMQGQTRNPLADPGLLGIEAGAALAVVLGIALLGIDGIGGYLWFALAGAGVAAVAVLSIAAGRGGPDPLSLVLAGAATTALLMAFTQAFVVRDGYTIAAYRVWGSGTVLGRGIEIFYQCLPLLLLGVLLAAASAPGLNLLQLGDDVARLLGQHPVRQKVLGVGAILVLTGTATAACGPIGFIGLTVPHVARALFGIDYRWIVACSGLLGGMLLTLADTIGRVIALPSEVHVGVVMALIGSPVFVLIVRRARLVSI